MDHVFELLRVKYLVDRYHMCDKQLLLCNWGIYQNIDHELLADALYVYSHRWISRSTDIFTLFGPHFEMLDDPIWIGTFLSHGHGHKAINDQLLTRIGEAKITHQQLMNLINACEGQRINCNINELKWIAFMNGEPIPDVPIPDIHVGVTHNSKAIVKIDVAKNLPIPYTLDTYLMCINTIRESITFECEVPEANKSVTVALEFPNPVYGLLKDPNLAAYAIIFRECITDHDKAVMRLLHIALKESTERMFYDMLTKFHKIIKKEMATGQSQPIHRLSNLSWFNDIILSFGLEYAWS